MKGMSVKGVSVLHKQHSWVNIFLKYQMNLHRLVDFLLKRVRTLGVGGG